MSIDAEPTFFISYARRDQPYVLRLADHLRGFQLPVWFDADIEVGARWAREIQARLERALAIIVVMSAAADGSHWVEVEILWGLKHDREFIPILLDDRRLFPLASSSYFDARGGVLFGPAEIKRMQRIRDAASPAPTGSPPPPPPPPPPVWSPAVPAVHRTVDDSLRRLGSHLGEGQFVLADILTTSLLLDAVDRLDQGYMRVADGRALPFELLAEVGDAWSRHTRGRHGFPAQVAFQRRLPNAVPARGHPFFAYLACELGWRPSWKTSAPRYGEFVREADRHVGFFPTLRNPQIERYPRWYDKWIDTVLAVHLRIRQWGERG